MLANSVVVTVTAAVTAAATTAPTACTFCGTDAHGCRLSFDLGKSDVKTVAVHNNKVLYAKDTKWDVTYKDGFDSPVIDALLFAGGLSVPTVASNIIGMMYSTEPWSAQGPQAALLKFTIRSDRPYHKGQLLWASRQTLAATLTRVLDVTVEATRPATRSTRPCRITLPNALPPLAILFLVEVVGASVLVGAVFTASIWLHLPRAP